MLPNFSEEIALLETAIAGLEIYEAAVYLLAHESREPDDGLDANSFAEAWGFLKEAVAKAEGREENA